MSSLLLSCPPPRHRALGAGSSCGSMSRTLGADTQTQPLPPWTCGRSPRGLPTQEYGGGGSAPGTEGTDPCHCPGCSLRPAGAGPRAGGPRGPASPRAEGRSGAHGQPWVASWARKNIGAGQALRGSQSASLREGKPRLGGGRGLTLYFPPHRRTSGGSGCQAPAKREV